MKNILTTLVLISINICVFAQKTNSRGEHLVKSIHWVNAFTQKEVGNKGDKWYHFRYDNDGNLIEVRKVWYSDFKDIAIEIYTKVEGNRKGKFALYIKGKQEFSCDCVFTFGENGNIDRLIEYSKTENHSQTFTLNYEDDDRISNIDTFTEVIGNNGYKIHNYEEYTWVNGNVVGFRYTNDDGYTQDFKTHYTDKKDNTNINLVSLTKHTAHPYNAHILFATEWCGKKPKNLVLKESGDNSFDYIYEGNLLKKINKKNSSYSKGYYLIEYVY